MPQSYQKRKDSTQLPSAEELLDILKKESQRKAVRYDFISKNTSIFNAHRELSELANTNDDWIENFPSLRLEDLVLKINETHSKISSFITNNPKYTELYANFYASLVPQDNLLPSEALFVFGAASNARIERAVELYQQNIAPKIIISGNNPHYLEASESEAQRMATFAIEKGVPTNNLILENQSVTLPDNVKRSIDLLESINWRPKSLTLIATNFVLTRTKMEWYKFCPWDMHINTVAAHPQSATFTAEGWTKDTSTVALVLNEYSKLILEAKIDLMRRDGELV